MGGLLKLVAAYGVAFAVGAGATTSIASARTSGKPPSGKNDLAVMAGIGVATYLVIKKVF